MDFKKEKIMYTFLTDEAVLEEARKRLIKINLQRPRKTKKIGLGEYITELIRKGLLHE